jgi:hypothetical protein
VNDTNIEMSGPGAYAVADMIQERDWESIEIMDELATRRRRMGELTVGREMDAAVAEALGCHPVKDETGWRRYWRCTCKPAIHTPAIPDDTMPNDILADYSISDADALAALDVVMADHPGWSWTMWYDGRLYHTEIFDPSDRVASDWSTHYATKAEAICRCILSLKGASDE